MNLILSKWASVIPQLWSELRKKSVSDYFLHVHQCDRSVKRLNRMYEVTEELLVQGF